MSRENHINSCTVIIIIVKIESAVEGRERVRTLYQPEDHNPTQPTHGRKKKREQLETKSKSKLSQQESIGSALKSRQAHTIKYRATNVVSKRHGDG